jgi:hypothetical protein
MGDCILETGGPGEARPPAGAGRDLQQNAKV